MRRGIIRVANCQHRHFELVANASMASKIDFGTPHASSTKISGAQRVNPLECRLIMIRRRATKGDEFLSAGSHAPLVIELDTAGGDSPCDELGRCSATRSREPASSWVLLPWRMGLFSYGATRLPRDTVALAGVMRALISSILTANHLLGLRHPLQSSGLDDSSGRLVSRSRERCTRVRPAMRSSVMVGTCDSSSSEVRTIGCGPPDRRRGCPQCSFRSQRVRLFRRADSEMRLDALNSFANESWRGI
jgi:hypothetical protein